MPVLARPDSIVVYGDFKNSFEYDYISNANAVIYNLGDGKTAETSVYDKDANKVMSMTAVRNGNEITVTYTSSAAFKITADDKTVDAPAADSGKIVISL